MGVVTTSSTLRKLVRKDLLASILLRMPSAGISAWNLPFFHTLIRMLSINSGDNSLADSMGLGRPSSTSTSP